MLAALQNGGNTQHIWTIAAELGIVFLAVTGLAVFLMRKFFQSTREEQGKRLGTSTPRTENPSAFMAASMQGVIQQLREQEKELERLHKIERERAEQTERLSEEVTRNMPAGLVVVNATGIISSSNPAAEQVLGIRGLGFRRYSEALGAASDLSRLLAECLATGKIYRREEVEHVPPAGDTRHLGVTISPIRRGEGKISGAICLLTDLTELAALQQRMRLKENLAALGELSAGIAHEFKNALATISGYAQMIPEASPGEASDYAMHILEQTRNITHVVMEFLKYARPLEIPDETVELEGVVERAVSEVAQALPQVEIGCEGTFGDVGGDEGLLRQALLNLARNAAEACAITGHGGRVVVRGEIVRSGEVGFQRISILDNGPGIAAEALPKLFRPFFTTKANGTGLGLAVVQKIIVQHGGQVEAQNRADRGAAFIVTLPLPRRAAEAVESRQDSI
ncbi:MAG TPA: ATP-binding protein [Candidatus Acidoferrum sp.]|jgi:PAS domain S-box-containing protein|nr:ATP-binding protein [Candidatus Acidoferrum sp.]